MTGGGSGTTLYNTGNLYRLASPDSSSIVQLQNSDTPSPGNENTVIVGTAGAAASDGRCVRLQGRAAVDGQDLVVARAVPYQGGFNVNSVTGFYVDTLNLEGAANRPIDYTCFYADPVNSAMATNVVGFKSTVTNANPGNYNFYAEGNAPNYFAGVTEHAAGVNVTGGSIRQGTLTAAASTDGGVWLNEFVRVYGNLTDFPEADRNDPQPFQILAADTATDNKSVRLSLNASGSAYFKGITEHEGGVKLTGGSLSVTSYKTASDNTFSVRVNADISTTTNTQELKLFDAYPAGTGGQAKDVIGFRASSRLNSRGTNVYGFYSTIGPSSLPNHWNFYAAGDAPNYFAGDIKVGGSTHYAELTLATGSSISRCLKLVRGTGGASASVKAIEVIADGATQWSVGYDGTASFSTFNGKHSNSNGS